MSTQGYYVRGSKAIRGSVIDELEIERGRLDVAFQRAWDNSSRGAVVYVDPANGLDTNDGLSWGTAVKTVAYAQLLCTSGRGDRIYCAPGTYAENIVITKDSVELVGFLDGGYDRPDFVGNAGIPLSVHAQAVVVSHIRCAATGAFVACQQQGNGFFYEDCVFDGAGLDGLMLLPDLDDDSYTASEGIVSASLFRGATAAGLRFKNPGPGVEGGVGPTDVEVRRCRFYSNGIDIADTDTAGSNDTTFLNCRVVDCDFMTRGGGVFVYVNLNAGGNNSGMLGGCRFNDTGLVAAQVVAPASVTLVGAFDAKGVVDASAF